MENTVPLYYYLLANVKWFIKSGKSNPVNLKITLILVNFHQSNIAMHVHLLAVLLFCQTLVSCQNTRENVAPPTPTANATLTTTHTTSWLEPEKALGPATDIIFQSFDGGQTWQDISAGLPQELSINSFHAQEKGIYLGHANGLYYSPMTNTTPVWGKEYLLSGHIHGIAAGKDGPYVHSARNGFMQNLAQNIWIPAFAGPTDKMIRTMLETQDGTIFMGCDNGIFKSSDKGKNWKQVFEDGMVLTIVESGGVLLGCGREGILRSDDGGEHWKLVISEGGVGIDVEVIDGGFAAITYNTTLKCRKVRISNDGGITWQAIDAGFPPSDQIASIKQLNGYFFCGHPDGIYRSADGGKTWELIRSSIEGKVFNLSVFGKILFAIPRNGGC